MDFILNFLHFILHLDEGLTDLIHQFGVWTYVILFLIIFAETGLVVTPFLPGDSLLFAAGALAATTGELNPAILIITLTLAAIIGDSVNYSIGHFFGPRVFSEKIRFLKKEHLDKTHAFYEKHGGKTIILARFIPIIRTFAPFVGGVGAMTYGKFILFNVIGAMMWVPLFTLLGYFFGTLEFVKNNFETVVIAIILISVMPAVYEYFKARREEKQVQTEVA